MSKEKPQYHDVFGFSENEKLFTRVRHERLLSFVENEQTNVHEVELTSNSYGAFLFISLSRQGDPFPGYVTFWGLGYHEQRERWLVKEWFWFRSSTRASLLERHLPHEEVLKLIEERRAEVEEWAAKAEPQS